jgi:P pilus assembly chaperone PapD
VSARSSWVAAALAGLVAVAVVAVDTVAPPATPAAPPTAAPTTSSVPQAGSSVCAVGDARGGATLTLSVAGADVGASQPAGVELLVGEDGEATRSTLPSIFPGAAVRVPGPSASLGAAEVRWRDAPVAVAREWALDGADGVPPVTIVGPCTASTSEQWWIPGLSTAGGDEARLRVANPYRTPATIAISFLTPEGAEAPLILRNVSVPPRSVREVVVNDTLPERGDLAATVQVVSGRVVAEGYQLRRSAIGGIDGGSLLLAAPQPAEEWTVPWLRDDDAAASWLWVANPGDRTANVELTLHTPDGGQVPDGLAEVSVPPGTQRRVDLSGTFPEGTAVVGLTARSNGAPVVVSAGTAISADDPASTGSSVQLGVAPDSRWTFSSASPATGRDEQLHLVNPGSTEAVVDIQLLTGVASQTPDELQQLRIGPGAARTIDLSEALAGAPAWSVFVRATAGEVVAGRVGQRTSEAEGPLRLVATTGTPSTAWRAVPSGLVANLDRELVNHLGTAGSSLAPLGDLPAPADELPAPGDGNEVQQPAPDEPDPSSVGIGDGSPRPS